MRHSRSPPLLHLLHIYTNLQQQTLPLRLADATIWPHVIVSGATSHDPGCGGVSPTDWQRARRSNMCLRAAGCHSRLVPTKAWGMDSSWRCMLQHVCTPLDILVNILDSRWTAIIISRAWDYPGAQYPPGLQALQVRSDFWMSHRVQASDLCYVFKLLHIRMNKSVFLWCRVKEQVRHKLLRDNFKEDKYRVHSLF